MLPLSDWRCIGIWQLHSQFIILLTITTVKKCKMLVWMVTGTFAPWSESSIIGTFAPGGKSSMDLSFPGAKVP